MLNAAHGGVAGIHDEKTAVQRIGKKAHGRIEAREVRHAVHQPRLTRGARGGFDGERAERGVGEKAAQRVIAGIGNQQTRVPTHPQNCARRAELRVQREGKRVERATLAGARAEAHRAADGDGFDLVVERVGDPEFAVVAERDAVGLIEARGVGGDVVQQIDFANRVVLRIGDENVSGGIGGETERRVEARGGAAGIDVSGLAGRAGEGRNGAVERDETDGVVAGIGDDEAATGEGNSRGTEEACDESGAVVGAAIAREITGERDE